MRTILAILFITFASQATSDTVMKCERKMDSGKMDIETFKLESSFFSLDKIFRREDGGWTDWCPSGEVIERIQPDKTWIEVRKVNILKIGEKGGKCSRFAIPTDSRNDDKAGMEVHDIVDFYLKTYVRDVETLIVNEVETRSFKRYYKCEHVN